MKYLVLVMVALSLFMSGCSDNMTLHKQDEAAAIEICQKNDGYDFYEMEQTFLSSVPYQMVVSCDDGAVFVLEFELLLEILQLLNQVSY